MNFEQFYQSFGLKAYPFNTFTTEDEKKADELFVEPVDYSLIKDAFKNARTIIMSGNRGTGKTAIIYDLMRNAPDKSLLCYIDDYSGINTESQLKEFYETIARQLVNTLLEKSISLQKSVFKLSKDDKVFFSLLINKFITATTRERINEQIEKIQLKRIARVCKKFTCFIRFALNYGLTTATKMINNVITTHFYMLPLINDNEVKDILPELDFSVESHFPDVDTSYSFIIKICKLIHNLGFASIVILLDKIDEDSRFTNDAEIISQFVSPLMTDNKLLLNSNLQIVISIWSVPFDLLKDDTRTQKYYCPTLLWTDNDLLKAFNRRVEVFSEIKGLEFNQFFSNNVSDNDKNLIMELSNHNPRDLWHIFNNLFHQQFALNENSNCLTPKAIEKGLYEFVRTFNYYEYYPRKKGARSDSMDAYKYINHLLKLSSPEFTANQLNTIAGTGSSTQNYITGMQNIGLVSRTESKRGAGIVYEIADPKVIYALEHDIQITRNR